MTFEIDKNNSALSVRELTIEETEIVSGGWGWLDFFTGAPVFRFIRDNAGEVITAAVGIAAAIGGNRVVVSRSGGSS